MAECYVDSAARLRRAEGSGARRGRGGRPGDQVRLDQRFDTGHPLFDAREPLKHLVHAGLRCVAGGVFDRVPDPGDGRLGGSGNQSRWEAIACGAGESDAAEMAEAAGC